VSSALSAPFLACAGVLCVSGVAKLRSPRAAVLALDLLRLPASTVSVRVLAAIELAIAVAGLAAPSPPTALVIGAAYTVFAITAVRLTSLRASCGCFGTSGAAASPVQALLSAVLAAVAAAAAGWPPGGAGWILDRPVTQALTLTVGVAGCVYGLVVAYTQLPGAWSAWSER